MDADEKRRYRAQSLRYKRSITAELNIEAIRNALDEIQDKCSDVRWYFDDDNTLLNALDGNDDEAYEFKMMFADLSVRVERLQDITEEQAEKEGFRSQPTLERGEEIHSYRLFQKYWNSTIKKSEQHPYGWDDNPLVWVYEFEKVEVEE